LNPNEFKLSCVLIEKDDCSIINSPIISDTEEQLISIENHHYNDKSSTLILTQQHNSSSSSSIKTLISHPVVSPPVTNSAIQIIKNEITDIKKDLDSFKVSFSFVSLSLLSTCHIIHLFLVRI
jgi:hypothetical protein